MNNFDETERLLACLRLMNISRYNTLAKKLNVVVQDQRTSYNANKNS